MATRFEWDQTKNRQNQSKHGVAFELAQLTFAYPHRVIAEDLQHRSGITVLEKPGTVSRPYGLLTVRT